MKKSMLWISATLLSLTLAGCGGGAGSSAPTATQIADLQAQGASQTAAEVAATASATVARFDPIKIAAMSVDAVQAIPPAAVAAMTPAQLIAMGSVSAFTADQTAAMTGAQQLASGLAYMGITRKPTITINSVTLAASTYPAGVPVGLPGTIDISYDLGGVANTPASIAGRITSYVAVSNTPAIDTSALNITRIANLDFSQAKSALVVNQTVFFTSNPFTMPSGYDYNKPAHIVTVACVSDLSYTRQSMTDSPPRICSQVSTPVTITQ